ncbi:Splicing factor U2AF-associated protein 2 [Escovopsis weberi]|uniref:Splicing factor U2AF-associated protein 2 n=1 Tax=Escovopsis weberi TaxID=150374 RepID=A0A0M9VRI1_ESCWE|nr:Splicing factor U2AF-associated protein 2 [Escovopsis weberi]
MGATDVSFPTDPAEFDSDDRISFSKLDNKFIAVHDDGNEYEFDAEHKTWTLVDDEPLDEDDAHESFEEHRHASEAAPQKRGYDSGNGYSTPEETRPARPNKKQKAPPQPRQNTAVYVTGLPLDATASEVHELFSRKGGVIAEEIDSGAPRIKMYADAEGRFKGDALVVFFKPQSVEMAIMLLDDTDFRFTASGTREGKMRVQAADSSYKKTNYDQDAGGSAAPDGSGKGNGSGSGSRSGNGNGSAKGPDQARAQRKDSDRQKIIKKTQKLDAKLADWDDDEDPYLAQAALAASARRDRRVILRHMFTLEELEEDPAALLEIKEDIRDECSKLGAVTNVVLYDLEPEGIVAVRFKDVEAAEACIQLMHGRSFAGRTVEAFWATGKEKFSKSKDDSAHDESD